VFFFLSFISSSSSHISHLILILSKLFNKNLIILSSLLSIILFFYFHLLKTDNEIHLYVMLTTNLLILFCVRIEVRRVKRSQFDAVQTMLERCMIMKTVVQSFHLRDNISSNSHNQSTKKINDMSMSVRDEKILLVE